MEVELRVLGELRLLVGGVDVTPRAPKERALLALLAVHRGRAVPADRLLEELWPDLPASQARHVLQVRVAALRKQLSAAGGTSLLASVSGGYRLQLDSDAVDAKRFEELVTAAEQRRREGDGPGSAGVLRAALGLWQGDAYADAQGCVTVELEASRLEELRLLALEERIAAELDAGEHRRLGPELDGVVTAHPLRERLWEQRILALYRSGRQAEALRACTEVRDRLREDLGVDPGPALRRLEAAVLAQDPALDWAPPPPPPGVRTPPEHPAEPVGGAAPGVLGGDGVLPAAEPLLGREVDLVRVAAMVRSHRLVTITGPGGVGKSRLAVAAAHEVAGAGPWRSHLVELAPLADPTGLVSTVAGVLQVTGLVTSVQDLAQQIGAAQLLVILDNCEHLVEDVAAVVTELLRACSGLRLLCTSQEALAVDREHVWPLQPLTTPAGVALFLERAGSVRPDLVHDPDAVAAIVEGLDGLPLAIELAAAKVATASASEIAARLDDRFRLLAGGVRGRDPRHRALKAMVEWSHELLAPDEQRVFRRLAVFAGSFTGAAARHVAGTGAPPPDRVGDHLDQLVRRSLVVADVGSGTTRYRLLQTLRQDARERLAESGEEDVIARRLAEWCVEDARGYRGVHSPDEEVWLAHGVAELDNLRCAVELAVEAGDADLGVRLVAPLLPLTALWRAELLAWARTVLALPGAAAHPDAGILFVIVAVMAANAGELDEALEACDEALRRPLPEDAWTLATCNRAAVLSYRGRMREAGTVVRAALDRVTDPRNRMVIESLQVGGEAFTGRPSGVDQGRLILAADETREPGIRSSVRSMAALARNARGEAREAVALLHEALLIAGPGLNRASVNLAHEVLELATGQLADEAPADLADRAARALELGKEYPLGLGFAVIGLLRSTHAHGEAHDAAVLAGYLFAHLDHFGFSSRSAEMMAGGPPGRFFTGATSPEFQRGQAMDADGFQAELDRLARHGPGPSPTDAPAPTLAE